jgi:DNA-binding ferritin-like protein (Dps family)
MKRVSTRSKWIIISSFLASAALITTLAVGMTVGSWEPNLVFTIGIITVAVAVFAGTIIFRLRKSGFEKKLNDDYAAQYERISDALTGSVMSRPEIRETKQDILSLMIEAQAQGRDVREIVGDDTAAFICRVQDSFGYRNRFLFSLLSVIQYGIFFMATMQLLIFFEAGGQMPFLDVTVDLALLIMFFLIVIVVYPLTRSAARKGKSALPFILPLVFGVAYIGMMILLDNTAYHLEWVRVFLPYDRYVVAARRTYGGDGRGTMRQMGAPTPLV